MQIFSLTQSSSGTRIARIGILPFPPLLCLSEALHHIKRSSRVVRLKGSRLSSVFEAILNSRKASARNFEIIASRDEKQKVIEKVSLSLDSSWRICISLPIIELSSAGATCDYESRYEWCARNIIYQLLVGEMKLSRSHSPSPLHLIIPGKILRDGRRLWQRRRGQRTVCGRRWTPNGMVTERVLHSLMGHIVVLLNDCVCDE
jgi:hypothetical protein